MKQILPEDFDNAVKQPWSTDTCLYAQAYRRLRGLQPNEPPKFDANQIVDFDIEFFGEGLGIGVPEAVEIFDKHFTNVGDEQEEILQNLRASLPITIQ